MTAPFVIDLGFSRNEYAAIIKGVGLAATLIGGFAGGFVARAYSLPASLLLGGILQAARQSRVFLAGHRRAQCGVAHFRHRRRKFHQRDRHGDLCRLPVGAVPQSAAHGDPICAFDRVGGRSAAPICPSGAGFIAAATGWVWFFAICALAGLPALALLAWLQQRGHFDALAPVTLPQKLNPAET